MGRTEVSLVETDVRDQRFQAMCRMLDDEYFRLFGEKVLKYETVNTIGEALAVFLLMKGDAVIGSGCIKQFGEHTAELKRVVICEDARRDGYGTTLVDALEKKAKELGCHKMVLETGREMPWAIAFYKKRGYNFIPNYEGYDGDEDVVCMKKEL